ncbi:hypothetical protein NZK35_10960 [Stieleria sp. ICT_E10.1]|uniref:hypothetical protein n=1 Tax=Stieleria sedimenti TaxID=2976331 RepID=UPI0021807801|nr:hypothetical protein [Stieleria sedimenti]MCS7467162.1 hypothetical protein [Stieleria sedimenti]
MNQQTEQLGVLVERQLQLESGVADALDALNDEMANLLDNAGIYGPKQSDLQQLSPLLEKLQHCQADSRKSRQILSRYVGAKATEQPDASQPPSEADDSLTSIKTILATLPAAESERLDANRRRLHDRLVAAQQRLTANQVVIFYSTEFHRRYLLGVLQCDVDEASYQADGLAFKLPTEKIIGRNC